MSIPTFFAKTQLGALRPACPASVDAMSAIAAGQIVEVKIHRPRNLQHHRKWWALLQLVSDNCEVPADTLNELIKFRTGHTHTVKTKHGIVEWPKSISFAAMDQTAFEAFFDRGVAYICEAVIPGLDRDQLLAEVEAILAGRTE